ncbi:MAG: tRNA-dihydrouridine synthase [bacterium]|nr:tRNA-dihydrouridine synthase [bacterium]
MTMTSGFWSQLKKPILALAPLYEVTDTAFRQIVARCGRPDVSFTEFVSVDGLSNEKSREKMIERFFRFEEIERPLVAQIWGTDPEKFRTVAALIRSLKFDGIDINMGCPDKTVLAMGAGAALIKNPKLTKEIVAATKEGAGDLPVSIKSRLGYDKNTVEEWMGHLAETKPAAITLHLRTMRQMSKVPADWESARRAGKIAHDNGILFLGNGDVRDKEDALKKIEDYDIDGVMVGRGIFGNPWFFNPSKRAEDVSIKEKLELLIAHAELFEALFKGTRPFMTLRKHYQNYAHGFKGAKELRNELMEAKNATELRLKINEYLKTNL